MKKRIDEILNLVNRRIEQHTISKKEYETIKKDVHLCIQNNVEVSQVDFCIPFVCIEFSEGYAIIYYYNP